MKEGALKWSLRLLGIMLFIVPFLIALGTHNWDIRAAVMPSEAEMSQVEDMLSGIFSGGSLESALTTGTPTFDGTTLSVSATINSPFNVQVLMIKLAERPKTKRLKIKVAEPGEKKPERLKLRVAEPSKKEEKLKLKIKVVESSPAEKERRIREIIENLWKKKGEASMDEIVSEAAKQGIDERDVEKFLESEKKKGKLALET